MKNTFMFLLFAFTFFSAGFITYKSIVADGNLKKVTGLGGIFFKSKDPKALKAWYNKNLGLQTDTYGTNFQWYHGSDSTKKGFTLWAPFNEKTKYFEPSTKEFMINYRVENLEWLMGELKKEGILALNKIDTFDYGKFVHIMDPEGNKIELWEPKDKVYEKMSTGGGVTK